MLNADDLKKKYQMGIVIGLLQSIVLFGVLIFIYLNKAAARAAETNHSNDIMIALGFALCFPPIILFFQEKFV